MRPRSITGPLILVVIGVLFLLNNLGHDIPFWRYLADYWPFLLIGLGIIRLAEVLFHFSRGSSLPIRSGGGGWIWILVILALPAIWFSAVGIHLGRIGTPGSLNILGSVFDYGVTASSSTDGVTRL